MAIQRVRPAFVATNLIVGENRTPRVVLEANRDHNSPRTARLERVVFVNDLTPEQALDAVCDREGELDIVTEVSPADAVRVEASEHARLVSFDANRLLAGIFNAWPDHDAPLGDPRVREALNLAVNRERLVADGLGGHGTPLAGLTAPWCHGIFPGPPPRARDPARARGLLAQSPWLDDCPLRLTTPVALAGLAGLIAG